ncbi:MAG: PEP-utilizing enzyme [Candidatus Paceibacterota bacterium]|jgi:pyruvate,water dikinase
MKIYDNSNLAESYSGVTTPLTFSFAKYVYQEVYKNFCNIMGVSKKTVRENADMFPEMVVYIGGRMYYDLTNWYRLVSFLPGYSFNKGFFEDMLGVNKKTDFEKKISKSFFERWFFYFPKTLWQAFKILISFVFMDYLVRRFCSNFDDTYTYYNGKDLSKENDKSLKEIFTLLTSKLVVYWKIPIANDFAVMVSTGIVRKLFNKWLPKENSYTFLYVGSTTPLISLDPGLVIMSIVETIKADKEFYNLFKSDKTPEIILSILRKQYQEHVISKKIFDYINKYGDRMPGELKLESKCLNEYPEILIQIIINAVKNDQAFLNKNIERASVKNCNIGLIRRLTLSFFLSWAKNTIRMREETRFKRTLIFGFARKLFVELGKKYTNDDLIDSSDDIFYLTLEEILSDTPKDKNKFKTLISDRKKSISLWKAIEFPRRIETNLSINSFEKSYTAKVEEKSVPEVMKGMVVSMGGLEKLTGEALVMKEFNFSINFNDKIIITTHTDPGWTLIFPLIKGLVVERGGMLSHAAIVARELNIPCIVGVENATNIVRSGEKIELNLNNGVVTKL